MTSTTALSMSEVAEILVQHLIENGYIETEYGIAVDVLDKVFNRVVKKQSSLDLGNLSGSELTRWMVRSGWLTLSADRMTVAGFPRHDIRWQAVLPLAPLTNQEKQLVMGLKKTGHSLQILTVRCPPSGYSSLMPNILQTMSKTANVPNIVIILNTRLAGGRNRSLVWPEYGVELKSCLLVHYLAKLNVSTLDTFGDQNLPFLWLEVGQKKPGQTNTILGVVYSDKDEESRRLVDHLQTALISRQTRPNTRVVVIGSIATSCLDSLREVGGRNGLDFNMGDGNIFMLVESGLLLDSDPVDVSGLEMGDVKFSKFANTYCNLCTREYRTVALLREHQETGRHRTNRIFQYYQNNKKTLLTSPHQLGLEINIEESDNAVQWNHEQGVVDVVSSPGQVKSFMIQLKNVREKDIEEDKDKTNPVGVVLEHIGIPREENIFRLSDEHGLTDTNQNRKIRVKYGRKYKVNVKASSSQVGHYKVPVIVSFYHDTQSERSVQDPNRWVMSHMAVELLLRVQTNEVRSLQPVKPFSQPRRRGIEWGRADETVPGLKARGDNSGADLLDRKVELGNYEIGKLRSKLIATDFKSDDDEPSKELTKCLDLLESSLVEENYCERWQLLLHCEEKQLQQDIRHYDMEGVTMEQVGRLLRLRVPGLQENRPSVIKGDRIYVRQTGNTDKEYEGYVHDVRQDSVDLGFSNRLVNSFVRNMKFNVRFTIGRYPLMNMHRAVSLSSTLKSCLFPQESTNSSSIGMPDIRCYNRLIEQNTEQLTAVKNIVGRTSGKAPYLVFGPPGTGKTVTVVEAIKQVHKLSPGARIIATAPSNAAADLLADRLYRDRHVGRSNILRLHASSRVVSTIPDLVKEISNIRDGRMFYPAMEKLSEYKVLVVTLVTAGRLVSAQFPANHFSHVFVDEAGQAQEPETLIPLAGLLSSSEISQVVLVGDPKQLGPVIRSTRGVRHGLNNSLLERLMILPLYSRKMINQTESYDSRYLTKLVRNFRSHPGLLEVPSRLFYHGELQPCADSIMSNSCLQFPGLPVAARKSDVPLIFHGVIGQDLKEERSPSFFNPEEAVTVLEYVRKLLDMKENRIQPKEIGVITPYRRQVQKIREKLGEHGFKEVTVGSTEEFQGQERRVVIVSTVRSNPEYVTLDSQYKLGFLTNPKRFNVAITRAKALLVVIGNPHILSQDPDWTALLDYAVSKGCYTGCPYDQETDEDLDRLEARFKRLLMDDSEISLLTQLEEPAWRSDA